MVVRIVTARVGYQYTIELEAHLFGELRLPEDADEAGASDDPGDVVATDDVRDI
jgi:hypothetical protein